MSSSLISLLACWKNSICARKALAASSRIISHANRSLSAVSRRMRSSSVSCGDADGASSALFASLSSASASASASGEGGAGATAAANGLLNKSRTAGSPSASPDDDDDDDDEEDDEEDEEDDDEGLSASSSRRATSTSATPIAANFSALELAGTDFFAPSAATPATTLHGGWFSPSVDIVYDYAVEVSKLFTKKKRVQ